MTSRTIIQPNGGTREVPCYMLTKTECLYIATKFNDEAPIGSLANRRLHPRKNIKNSVLPFILAKVVMLSEGSTRLP